MKPGEPYNPAELWGPGILPHWLLCRTEIGQGAKLTFAYLTRYAGRTGPLLERIAADLGVTRRTVLEHLRSLKASGLLDTSRSGPGRGSVYVFLWHEWAGELLQLPRPREPVPVTGDGRFLRRPSVRGRRVGRLARQRGPR